MQTDHQTYEMRDRVLRSIGYPSYAAYLESALWQSIRAKVLGHCKGKCRLCDQAAKVVHHFRYGRTVLRGKKFGRDLVPLCHECHEKIEFTSDRVKRSLRQAQIRFVELLDEIGYWNLKPYVRKIPSYARLGLKGMSTSGCCTACGKKARKGYKCCRACLKASLLRGAVNDLKKGKAAMTSRRFGDDMRTTQGRS